MVIEQETTKTIFTTLMKLWSCLSQKIPKNCSVPVTVIPGISYIISLLQNVSESTRISSPCWGLIHKHLTQKVKRTKGSYYRTSHSRKQVPFPKKEDSSETYLKNQAHNGSSSLEKRRGFQTFLCQHVVPFTQIKTESTSRRTIHSFLRHS